MYCPKCGSKNDDGAQFCGSCGSKLNAPQEAKQAPAVSTTPTGGVTTGDGSTAAAGHKTGRILVIIGVVVVVVAAIAAFLTGGFGLLGPTVRDSVNDYSWEELSKISAEISEASDETGAVEVAKKFNLITPDGKLDGTQVKDFQLTDGQNVQVQIAGFRHDDKTDGGKAGITFIFMDVIARRAMNSNDTNSGGWEKSEMRSWLASEGMDMLPEDLRDRIIAVDKSTNNVGITDSLDSITVTSDKLWLFSSAELCEEVGNISPEIGAKIINSEGSEYKLCRDMNVTDYGHNDILVRRFNNDYCDWWERTPWPFAGEPDRCNFSYVDTYGEIGRLFKGVMTVQGVVPGFCI